tara:strand:- start:404 stop:904 length:501 start_codon:yes stop_codon:yes gene_type:complete
MRWNVLTIKGKNIQEYTQDLVAKLREVDFGIVDTVVIEQQVNRNTQMKVLSHVIQTFFCCHHRVTGECIVFLSAKLKLQPLTREYMKILEEVMHKLHLVSGSIGRKEIKTLSIELTSSILKSKCPDLRWLEMFEGHKKRDDLADAFLQAIVFKIRRQKNEIDLLLD